MTCSSCRVFGERTHAERSDGSGRNCNEWTIQRSTGTTPFTIDILRRLLTKACKTFRSVQVLCERGLQEDAVAMATAPAMKRRGGVCGLAIVIGTRASFAEALMLRLRARSPAQVPHFCQVQKRGRPYGRTVPSRQSACSPRQGCWPARSPRGAPPGFAPTWPFSE